jgi:hypothetical protein
MDYEVFLLARIREEYLRTHGDSRSSLTAAQEPKHQPAVRTFAAGSGTSRVQTTNACRQRFTIRYCRYTMTPVIRNMTRVAAAAYP